MVPRSNEIMKLKKHKTAAVENITRMEVVKDKKDNA